MHVIAQLVCETSPSGHFQRWCIEFRDKDKPEGEPRILVTFKKREDAWDVDGTLECEGDLGAGFPMNGFVVRFRCAIIYAFF